MASIDISKLRHYVNAARTAHAAVITLMAKRNEARTEIVRCRTNLADYQSSHGALRRVQREAQLDAVLKSAEQTLSMIEADLDRARDKWSHAARIKVRVMEYAASHIAIPDDLKDI